jgi:hypothetical protein
MAAPTSNNWEKRDKKPSYWELPLFGVQLYFTSILDASAQGEAELANGPQADHVTHLSTQATKAWSL